MYCSTVLGPELLQVDFSYTVHSLIADTYRLLFSETMYAVESPVRWHICYLAYCYLAVSTLAVCYLAYIINLSIIWHILQKVLKSNIS